MDTVRVLICNETNSGNRKGWTKHVEEVDQTKDNGYAFIGRFLNNQEYDLPVGAVLVQKNPMGSVKSGYHEGVCLVVQQDGSLKQIHTKTYKWNENFLSFRDLVFGALKS